MAWLTEISEDIATQFREMLNASTRATMSGCVEWTGSTKTDPFGARYGRAHYLEGGKRRLTGAHRASFLLHKGAIGPALTVHHECYNTLCVNPSHLSLLTAGDNSRDGNPGRKPLTPKFSTDGRETCRYGRPWTDDNVRFRPNGYGECKTCTNIRVLAYHARKKMTT